MFKIDIIANTGVRLSINIDIQLLTGKHRALLALLTLSVAFTSAPPSSK